MACDEKSGTLARYASYRRAGDLVFLSGIIAVDPGIGRIVHDLSDIPEETAIAIGKTGEFSVDAKQGRILAQSWYVLDRIRAINESLGGKSDNVIKLVQYFRNLDQFPYYSKVRNMFYPNAVPASTVVEVSALRPSDEIVIECEATLWLPEIVTY